MGVRLEIHDPHDRVLDTWLENLLRHHGVDPHGPAELGCYSWAALIALRFEVATLGGRVLPEINRAANLRLPLLRANHVEFPDQDALFAFLLTWS